MIVEDSPIDIYINTRLLEQSKIANEIVVKETGFQALEFIKEHVNHPETLPEIILLDLNMPGADGFDFLSEFRNLNDKVKSHVKIVILTSSDKTEDIHSSINNPLVKRYFIKPLTDHIIAEIEKLLK